MQRRQRRPTRLQLTRLVGRAAVALGATALCGAGIAAAAQGEPPAPAGDTAAVTTAAGSLTTMARGGSRLLGPLVCCAVALPLAACAGNGDGPRGVIAVSGGALSTKGAILLIAPGDEETRRLHVPDVLARYDLSPDGSRLAATGGKGIWLLRTDGSGTRRILSETVGEEHPFGPGEVAWSPDGARLAFARADDTLFTISADGGDVKRVVSHADQPDWSSDAEIVFVRRPDQSSRAGTISAIGSDGRGLRTLVARGRWTEPRLSPDGSTIAFEGREGIYLAPTSGGAARLFIRNGRGAAWSPDGRYLAFAREVRCAHAACSSRVFVVPRSGGEARAYGPAASDMGPLSWSR